MTVYFIQAIAGGPIKIGYARDVEKRLRDLQCGSPFVLRVICTEEGGQKYEAQLHRRFAKWRLHGEWFRLEGELKDHLAAMRVTPAGMKHIYADIPNPANHGRRMPPGRWWMACRHVLCEMGDGEWVTARQIVDRLELTKETQSRVWGALDKLHKNGWVDKKSEKREPHHHGRPAPHLWRRNITPKEAVRPRLLSSPASQ